MWNKSPYQVTLLRLVYLVMSESVSLEKKKTFFSLRRIISGCIHHTERGEFSQILILKQVYYSAFLYIQKNSVLINSLAFWVSIEILLISSKRRFPWLYLSYLPVLWSHRHLFLFALLQNCFLCWNHGNGDMCHLHLMRPCCVALGQVLIWGLNPDWLRSFVYWVSSVGRYRWLFFFLSLSPTPGD